jgi:hypothetical protein
VGSRAGLDAEENTKILALFDERLSESFFYSNITSTGIPWIYYTALITTILEDT